MQLKISFRCSDLLLPVAYRQIVQGMLYRQLTQKPDYARWLHDSGNTCDRRNFKLFTFGELQGSYTFLRESKQLCFHNHVQLEVRSVDPQFIKLLLMALPEGSRAELNYQTLAVESVRLENYLISASSILVQTLTPIAAHITEKGTGYFRWYGPEEPEFYRQLIHNTERKYESLYPRQKCGAMQLAPAEPGCFRKIVTSYKGTRVNAWNGRFYLSGSLQLLNFLYDTGLGERNAQGFGMFRVLEEVQKAD